MADVSGLSALAAGSVVVPLPDAPPNKQIGEGRYGYKYVLQMGRVWRGVRAAARYNMCWNPLGTSETARLF